MAGRFYPDDPQSLRALIAGLLDDAAAPPVAARGGIVPHAALQYSGACAAHVFARLSVPPLVVLIAPNHTGRLGAGGGVSGWMRGAFATPLGNVPVDAAFMARLERQGGAVAHDPAAHAAEHAVEVLLPFLQVAAPAAAIAPLVLAFDDWAACERLAGALADAIAAWPSAVLLLASSDMTHYESAAAAARKDREVLASVERLDGRGVLEACRRQHVTMCGRAPAAVVLEATRRLGAERAEVVDYRHSGWVTGDEQSVVSYAGVLIS